MELVMIFLAMGRVLTVSTWLEFFTIKIESP